MNSISNNKHILKTYFSNYLLNIRGVKQSTVNHYLDALNNISKRLKFMGIVDEDIYEIADLDYLAHARDMLFSDPDFTVANERGKRMYSAGFNNYYRFASGSDLQQEGARNRTIRYAI